MEAALFVSMVCCIWFMYKLYLAEKKYQKDFSDFSTAFVVNQCIIDQLLEEKMRSEHKVVLDFDLSNVLDAVSFTEEFKSKYDITFVDGKIRFMHMFLPIDI